MAGTDATQKFFEALNESSDAFIDGIRAASDRSHRFTIALIEQAQEGQRESAELVRRWAASPFDIGGIYSALIDNATKSQGRAMEAARMWFSEMSDAQKESRNVVQRMVDANRKAGEASIEVARGMFTRAGEAMQSMTDGNGRTAQEPSKAIEAARPSAPPPQPSSGI